jgi:hypothetical protein
MDIHRIAPPVRRHLFVNPPEPERTEVRIEFLNERSADIQRLLVDLLQRGTEAGARSLETVANTSSIIDAVSLPVFVFCRLGW